MFDIIIYEEIKIMMKDGSDVDKLRRVVVGEEEKEESGNDNGDDDGYDNEKNFEEGVGRAQYNYGDVEERGNRGAENCIRLQTWQPESERGLSFVDQHTDKQTDTPSCGHSSSGQGQC